MEPISTILTTAAGYILKAAASSKTGQKAKDELLESFWTWIRPLFIKDIPDIEQTADAETTEEKVSRKLLELVENDESFFEELTQRVDALKTTGVKEKNIVSKSIRRVKRIKIGDKTYSPNETYTRKNIVEGDVEDADEFILGDGH